MPTDPVVIDLGTVDLGTADLGTGDLGTVDPGGAGLDAAGRMDADPGGPPGLAPPAAASGPRPLGVRLRRWLPLAGLALVLVGSTSAADPLSARLAPHFEVGAGGTSAVVLTGDTLFVAAGAAASVTEPHPEWSVSAYRLRDGLPLWTAEHDSSSRQRSVEVQAVAGVPLVTIWASRRGANNWPPVLVDGETTAYDPVTGELRWRYPGFVAGAADGQVVLDAIDYEGNPPAAMAYRVVTVDLVTGRAANTFRLPLTPGPDGLRPYVWTVSPDGRHLATLDRDGRLTVRDLARGTQRATDTGRPWHDASLLIDGDLLRVSTLRDRERIHVAYDLDLTRRWILADQPAAARITACGPVWCLRTPDGLAALDPATGALRWRAEGRGLAATWLGPPWPEDRLHLSDQVVVDAASGRAELALADWLPLVQGLGDSPPVPLVYQRGEPAHHPGHPQYDPGRLWLGQVATDLSGVSVLGGLDGVHSCHAGDHHVACVTVDRRVQVWRLRPLG